MTALAPKIYPEDVRRTSTAMSAALVAIVDGLLPDRTPIDVDYILYKPGDTKYIKVALRQPSAGVVEIAFTLENGSSSLVTWRKNKFNNWANIDDVTRSQGSGFTLTSFDQVRALNHAVLVIRGLVRDSDEG